MVGRHQRTALGLAGILLIGYWGVILSGAGDLLSCSCFGPAGPRLGFGQHIALLSVMTASWGGLIWRAPAERAVLANRRHRVAAAVLLMAATTLAYLSGGRWRVEVVKKIDALRVALDPETR
ncbi:MAG: hypothetical protein M1598_06925 [Actinobacteria bacterium]|nr:hypothetical protein [Actinomycetota bacterium]